MDRPFLEGSVATIPSHNALQSDDLPWTHAVLPIYPAYGEQLGQVKPVLPFPLRFQGSNLTNANVGFEIS